MSDGRDKLSIFVINCDSSQCRYLPSRRPRPGPHLLGWLGCLSLRGFERETHAPPGLSHLAWDSVKVPLSSARGCEVVTQHRVLEAAAH